MVRRHKDKFKIESLVANSSAEAFLKQAEEFRPSYAVLADERAAAEIKDKIPEGVRFAWGEGAAAEAVSYGDTAFVAATGFAGLKYTLKAIELKKDIALANKETLVCGGELVMREISRAGVRLMPVDSEHSALWQALGFRLDAPFRRLIITASGGPFYSYTKDRLEKVTPRDALRHPTWSMGAKITIDSASMMNKGLEIIEAHHLYGLPLERIGVLVHPQSLVHSLVEFEDGSLMAQAGTPDMRMPIAYCLAWPLCLDAGVPPLDLARSGALTFEEPDLHSFPCLELACRTIGKGSALPVALNAANEVAVEAFLSGRIGFMDIPDIIGRALDECSAPDPASLEAIETLDHETRLRVGLWIEKV